MKMPLEMTEVLATVTMPEGTVVVGITGGRCVTQYAGDRNGASGYRTWAVRPRLAMAVAYGVAQLQENGMTWMSASDLFASLAIDAIVNDIA